jgi:hypothetical protein
MEATEETTTEFRRWASIERLEQMVSITEKIHGSNAQILVTETEVRAGSRERWLDRVQDNYGFCNHVTEHADEIRELLGLGRHYGEWYGAGINSSYGLKEKRLALFDTRWADKPRPAWCDVVPVLYRGLYYPAVLAETMEKLKAGGSVLQPGFMGAEGVVVRFERSGVLMKHVFALEDTAWRKGYRDPETKNAEREAKSAMLVELGAKYLQPIRLEKLLSSDEQYLIGYPQTLPQIVKLYCADLERETADLDPEAWKAAKKTLFHFVRSQIEEKR